MTMQYSGISGVWCRFSNYHISEPPMPKNVPAALVDHFRYLRPTPDARLEAYSLTMNHEGDKAGGDQSVTYEDIRDIDLYDENAILDWCKRFGLLGILPQRTVLIRLAPRWRPLVDSRDPCLFPAQTSYSRTSVGWNGTSQSTLRNKNSMVIDVDEEHRMEDWIGRLVDLEDTIHPPASTIISRLFTTQFEETGLGEAISRYFPDLSDGDQDTHEYPRPLSDEFWHQYGESLGEFRSAVTQFRNMVEAFGNQGPLEYLPEEALRGLRWAQQSLDSLASVSPVVEFDENGHIVPKWSFPSLLSIFAFSLWQDLVGGKSVHQCTRSKCRKVFLSGNTKRQYCSDRCRQAEEKARQRIRKPSS